MSEISVVRGEVGGTVKPVLAKVTVRNDHYELDLNSLNFDEKRDARKLLDGNGAPLGMQLIAGDELAPYVAAFIAVQRARDGVEFAEIAKLTAYELEIVVVLEDDEAVAPLDDDSATPSSPAAATPKRAKGSSPKPSTAASSSTGGSGSPS